MLVDDPRGGEHGFGALLQATDDIEVIAEADSGEDDCQQIAGSAPGQWW